MTVRGWCAATMVVAQREVAARVRDGSAIVTAIVAPVVLGVIISGALWTLQASAHRRVTIAVAADDDARARLHDRFAAAGAIELRDAPSTATAWAWVRSGRVDAAVSVGAGTTEVRLGHRNPIAAEVARAVTVAAAPGAADPDAAVDLTTEPVESSGGGWRVDSAFPILAVGFLFSSVGGAAASLWQERREGLSARMISFTGAPSSLLVAKAIAHTLTGAATVAAAWLTAETVFGARWGAPLGVLAVGFAASATATALALALATLARSEAQVSSIIPVLGVVCGLAGAPAMLAAQLPTGLDLATRIVPSAWALRGLQAVAGGNAAGAAGPLVALALLTIACLSVALRRVAVTEL